MIIQVVSVLNRATDYFAEFRPSGTIRWSALISKSADCGRFLLFPISTLLLSSFVDFKRLFLELNEEMKGEGSWRAE